LAAIRAVAEKLRIDLQILELRNAGELDEVLGALTKGASRPLVQLSSPLFDGHAKRIADFASKHRIASISMFKRFPESGGLMSYGPNQPEYYKRLSVFIDKILKGAKPADLPIEQPTKFDLVINFNASRALGLTLPHSLVARADQVIE